jgi:selenocysteine-specific translation elongation factor
LEGILAGVFAVDQKAKGEFESSVAKKSEAEGIIVYHRKEGVRRVSFLDDATFPERIQGYARVASLSDRAYYLFPSAGRLSPPDGELAVLLESFGIPGSVVVPDGIVSADSVRSAFKGTILESYPVEDRATGSSALDLSHAEPRPDFPSKGTLIYVDRAFNVKGIGTVALGFVLSGTVSVHDELRLLPLPKETVAEVKGIQINDEDYDTAGRGMRVGLALRGVDARDMQKSAWLDDGSFPLSDSLSFRFRASPYYRQPVVGRELHLQLAGEMVTAFISQGAGDGELAAALPFQVPTWRGMRLTLTDLNGKNLRVAGGGICNP